MSQDKQHERLREARIKAGFRSMKAAAEAYDWSYNTYKANECGTRLMSKDNAQKYAKRFKVDLQWLLFGENKPTAPSGMHIEIKNEVGAGAEVYPFEEGVIDEEWIPVNFNNGIVIKGDSMYPMFDPGTLIVFEDGMDWVAPSRQILDTVCLCKLKDGRQLIKRVQEGSGPGFWDLQSLNAPIIRDVELVEVMPFHEVVVLVRK